MTVFRTQDNPVKFWYMYFLISHSLHSIQIKPSSLHKPRRTYASPKSLRPMAAPETSSSSFLTAVSHQLSISVKLMTPTEPLLPSCQRHLHPAHIAGGALPRVQERLHRHAWDAHDGSHMDVCFKCEKVKLAMRVFEEMPVVSHGARTSRGSCTRG
jgi:hypothetical protein